MFSMHSAIEDSFTFFIIMERGWVIWDLYFTFFKAYLVHRCDMCIQGDPNQNLVFQMAVAQKLCISDPMLVNMGLRSGNFLAKNA